MPVIFRSPKYPLPAYSLAMSLGRMDIIKSLDLVMSVQRNAKNLSSAPFAAKYAARDVHVSKETEAIWYCNGDGEYGDDSLSIDAMKATQASPTLRNFELHQIPEVVLNSFLKPYQELDDDPQKRKLGL